MPTSSIKLQDVLRQIDGKTAELAALRPVNPEYEARLWEKFRLEWNYASNHIEGNTLTYGETKLLLIFDQLPTEPHTLREVEEMKAYDVAVALVREWAAEPDRELTEADIRALNETNLVRPFWKEALTPDGQPTRRLISIGEYKQHPNSMRLANGEMFDYTAPGDVPRKMGELMNWYRTEGQELHPAMTAALLHYRFVRIHPFDDGNGRISRLLLNYHLLRKKLPPVIIKSDDKRNYLFALQKADAGNQEAFCVYVAEQALWSLDLSIKAAKGESVEETGDWEKGVKLLLRNAESKGQKQKLDKAGREERLAKWLEHNIPILKGAFRQYFEPFNPFFEKAECSAYLLHHTADIPIATTLNDDKPDWIDYSKGIINGRYQPKITLSYYFEGFEYPSADALATLDKPEIDLQVMADNIFFGDKTLPISSMMILSNSDLEPIRVKAVIFKKEIETLLNDHEG
ncbi:MAG: Fic family protein [Saprospiraceae bacterium]